MTYKFIFVLILISFLEGAALMATELVGAKMTTPFFGTSIYVWAAVFSVTFLGLAMGYFIGARLSLKINKLTTLRFIILFCVIFSIITPFIGNFFMNLLITMPLIAGVIITVSLFLFPLIFGFGMITPIIIQLINETQINGGKSSGIVYSISTLGGVIGTFCFGFYFIPFLGIDISFFIISFMMLLALVISFLVKREGAN